MGMTERFHFMLILFAALGSGLVAGVFFAFSTFVMKALARLPAAQGIAAMQSINVVVLNPWFLGVFMGTALLCSLALLDALLHWPEPGGMFVIVGSALYLLGSLGVTMACNVPRNESLRTLSPTGTEAARDWTTYVRDWTTWNHVRTIASFAAAAAFSIALGR
jgi:uncharacterized membrane protein